MRVIILGGGFGGLNAAQRLANNAKGMDLEIALVSDQPFFTFRPSLIWVPFGGREIDEIQTPLRPMLEDIGVRYIHDRADRLSPNENEIELTSGDRLRYDMLIVATGATPDFEKINGLPREKVCSIYHPEAALRTRERLQNLRNGASIVIGVAPGNPSPALSYEFTFELETYLKKRSIEADVSYVTYEKDLFEQAGEGATNVLTKNMEEKGIHYYLDASIDSVTEEEVILGDGTSLAYDLALLLPPYRGADCIFNSPDLDHKNGLLFVNDCLQSVQYENIFVVGDANRFVDKKVLKNGRAAELQGKLAAENALAAIRGETELRRYKDSFLGMIEVGEEGMFVLKYPTAKILRKISKGWAFDGRITHWMKVVYEKYYLWKMR